MDVNGDKMTTLHGQKDIITIPDDRLMPCIQGRHAEIVIPSASILKRGTSSQVIEAASVFYERYNWDGGNIRSQFNVLDDYAQARCHPGMRRA